MVAILLTLVILIITVQNICLKHFNIHFMKNEACYYLYNFYFTLVAAIILSFGLKFQGVSQITILLGITYGVLFVFTFYFFTKGLESGPYSFTNLMFSFSLIIPIFFGLILWNEKISIFQIIGLVLLLFTFYFGNASTESDGANKKTNIKWFIYCLVAFIGNGFLMSTLKGQQMAMPGKEINEFIVIGFSSSSIVSIILWAYKRHIKGESTSHLKDKKFIYLFLIYAVALSGSTFLNSYLAGITPAVIQYPIMNGGIIIVAAIISVFVYKEKITQKKLIGLILGFISIILLCL